MSNQLSRCWAEIDRAALSFNIHLLNQIGPDMMAVVKADAYGHDVDIVVPTLLENGVSHFAVATVEEALELRSLPNMADKSLYLMAAVLDLDVEEIVSQRLIPFVTDTMFVEALSKEAVRRGSTAEIHIEVDTGIGRAGVSQETLLPTLLHWNSLPGIHVTGICTHFTSADSSDPSDGADQYLLFEKSLATIPRPLIQRLAIHAANSPASLRIPQSAATLIRPGLLLYGINPFADQSEAFSYRPALSLKARALLVRRLPAGSDISYSRTYRLPADATIATVGIGYGDGYPRRLSNIGKALLPDGTSAPIRGRVCMDQICMEIPGDTTLAPGDVVTLIGSVGSSKITIGEIAALIGATPHEITTCLTARVRRV